MQFFLTLWKLAGIYGQLPRSIRITEEITVSQQIPPSGWFADLRTGTHKGRLVAVKTLRVTPEDDPSKIRKVRAKNLQPGQDSEHPVPAFLSNGRSLELTVTPKRLETDWSPRRYVERIVHHSVRVDGSRQHHGIYQETSREQTGTGTCNPCPRYMFVSLISAKVARGGRGPEAPPPCETYPWRPQRG